MTRLVLVVLVMLVAGPVCGADAVVKIFDATLNELADTLEPIQFRSPVNGAPRPIEIDTWFGTITICGGHWSADVTDVRFRSRPGRVDVSGTVVGKYSCLLDLTFNGSFSTTADVSYVQAAREVRVSVNPTSVNVSIGPFSRTIQVSEGLRIPSMPIATSRFFFETAGDTRSMRMTPQSVSAIEREGFIELQADVLLW